MSEEQLVPLGYDESFRFSCTRQVLCFNACCRDLNQFLTPYDILRLKGHLEISSEEFLAKYTMQHVGPQTGLPVVSLKGVPDRDWACPFVAPEGCSVYENRPSSCRSYPLTRLALRNRETGRIEEHYFLMKEPHCLGFDQPVRQSVAEWVEVQGLAPYNAENDRFMELISLKNQHRPGPLDLAAQHLFSTAMYDLDRFRRQISEKDLLSSDPPDEDTLARIGTDDVALLHLAIGWVKKALFQDKPE